MLEILQVLESCKCWNLVTCLASNAIRSPSFCKPIVLAQPPTQQCTAKKLKVATAEAKNRNDACDCDRMVFVALAIDTHARQEGNNQEDKADGNGSADAKGRSHVT